MNCNLTSTQKQILFQMTSILTNKDLQIILEFSPYAIEVNDYLKTKEKDFLYFCQSPQVIAYIFFGI